MDIMSGPQLDVHIGSDETEQEMSIKNIFDNGYILKLATLADEEDGVETGVETDSFSVMNVDDFLNENNLDIYNLATTEVNKSSAGSVSSMTTGFFSDFRISSPNASTDTEDQADSSSSLDLPHSPVSSHSLNSSDEVQSPQPCRKNKNALPKGVNNFLYAESKCARKEREEEERKLSLKIQAKFSAEELALATIPGADFDPTMRQFSSDELRPQPIIRKRRKTYVLPDSKDDKYWYKRKTNNIAARRSREARRLKENQIALRAAFLEQENSAIKIALDKLCNTNKKLKLENKLLVEQLQKL